MRVGYILKEFPRLSETFILTEILELERLGCEVTIFSRYNPTETVSHESLSRLRAEVIPLEPLLRERLWEPFEIHRRLARRFGREHEASLDVALSHRNREEMRYWLLGGFVAEEASRRALDLLHGHFATGSASVARYASRITGIPFSFTAHAKDIYADEVDHGRLMRILEEAATVVTISEANLQFLRCLSPASSIRLVYNGIDLERFAPAPVRLVEQGRPLEPFVLSIGRLVEKKGFAKLIDAIALLRTRGVRVGCRIVGIGPLEEELRARAAERSVAVEFMGPASQEDLAAIHLPAASVFALPCVVAGDGDRDGIPTTLLEAMASGIPVVSTRLSGIPEAVPHREAGLLAEPGDADGLAEALAETLADPDAARRRALFARRHVESRFDARKNVPSLLEAFLHAAAASDVDARRGMRAASESSIGAAARE